MNEPLKSNRIYTSRIFSKRNFSTERNWKFNQDQIKEEIQRLKTFLSQSNIHHELRIRDLRISYEDQLQNMRNESEKETKNLQNELWDLNATLNQEKELKITKLHRLTIIKMNLNEKIESLNEKKNEHLEKVREIEHEKLQKHDERIRELEIELIEAKTKNEIEKKKFESTMNQTRIAIERFIQEKTFICENLKNERSQYKEQLDKLIKDNKDKIFIIENELKNSKSKIENHEGNIEKVIKIQMSERVSGLEQNINEKENKIKKIKITNEMLVDKINKLEKILYGKIPKDYLY